MLTLGVPIVIPAAGVEGAAAECDLPMAATAPPAAPAPINAIQSHFLLLLLRAPVRSVGALVMRTEGCAVRGV